MNNNQNDLIRFAMEKIKRDEKFKPACNTFIIGDGIGATGPTGPTHALISESKHIFLTIFLV